MSEAVIKRLGQALAEATGQRDLVALIIYAPFGIVRGEITQANFQAAASLAHDGDDGDDGDGLIELHRVTVEHYSNHLPTGNYDHLHLKLKQISGFVIIKEL